MKQTFPTSVAIEEATRRELIEIMNTLLASSVDLYTQVKEAHWNIKGPHFISRHELFDRVADHARAWSDVVAERISTLGGYARGTARDAALKSKLEAYDASAVRGSEHVRVVVDHLAAYCKLSREAVAVAARLNEPVTEDMCIEITRQAELDMWFLESHLQG